MKCRGFIPCPSPKTKEENKHLSLSLSDIPPCISVFFCGCFGRGRVVLLGFGERRCGSLLLTNIRTVICHEILGSLENILHLVDSEQKSSGITTGQAN